MKDPHAEKIAAVRAILHETWPRCFVGKGQSKKPLAISISNQIMRALPEIGWMNLSRALSDYTAGPTYLRNCVANAERVNLEGEPDGIVTEKQAGFAATRLQANEAFWASKKRKPVKAGALANV